MKAVIIHLNNIEDISDFSKTITPMKTDFDITCGRYVVDAKSIMGIMALDLSMPLKLEIHTDSPEEYSQIISKINKYVA